MDDYELLEQLKPLIDEILYDLDSHFPSDALTDEYYLRFYEHYIVPITNIIDNKKR